MKGKFKIVNESVRTLVAKRILSLPLDEVHEVLVHPFKADRTAEQKGYYFRIVGIMAPDLGYRKDELHDVCKVEMLHPIYMSDEEMVEYHDLVQSLDAALKLKAIDNQKYRSLLAAITSTNNAKLKHMSALIEDVHHLAAEHQIRLPVLEHK